MGRQAEDREDTMSDVTTKLTDDDAKLDALLRQARPAADAAREAALLDRIMAATEKGPRLVVAAHSAPVATAAVASPDLVPAAAPALGRRARRDIWAAGSLLAASLVVGVFLGQSTYTETTVRRIEQATGVMLASVSQDLALSLASAEDEDE
jgi:hypothetical protein